MDTGELLDRTFSLYRRNFALFFGIMILPALLSSLGGLSISMLQPRFDPSEGIPGDFGLAEILLFFAVFAGSFALNIIVHSAAIAAGTLAVSEVHQDRTISIARCYGMTGRRFGSLLGLSLALTMIMFMGFTISILAGMMVGFALGLIHTALALIGMLVSFAGMLATAVWLIRYGLAVPALMLERLSVGGSLSRSALLTKGFRMRVFLVVFVTMLISFVAAFIFQGPFFVAGWLLMEDGLIPFWLRALQGISGSIGAALSGPLLIIGIALLYLDVRSRVEAAR